MVNALAVGLVINAKDRATKVVGQVGRAFDKLDKKGKQLAKGFGQIAKGMKTFAIAGAAVGAGLLLMANQAAGFEQQMSAVKSVLLGVADSEIVKIEAEVKRLGATTSKSATEAAKGAEALARAGFSATETVAALSSVLAAAEADNIDLATATNIVAGSVKAFGLEASEATKVADIFALTSARTNTNMTQLAEGMKYVGPVARGLGQSINDTAFALGLLANAGLQGSIGGTALKNMMNKLSTLSPQMSKKFNDLGIQIQDTKGDMLPMADVIENLTKALPKMGGNLERNKFLVDAFGLRGQAAASNLAAGFDSMNKVTADGTTGFEKLRLEIKNVDGAAKKMAKERLNNLRGAFTLVKSAIEGISIEMFSGPLKALTPIIKQSAEALGRLSEGMRNFDAVIAGTYSPTMDEGGLLTKSATVSMLEFGAGVKIAFGEMAAGITWLGKMKDKMMSVFGGGDSVTNVSTGKFVAWGAVIMSVLAVVVGGIALVAVPLVLAGKAILAGLATIASAVAWPLAILGVFIAYIQATRKEGQSFGERMSEVFGTLKTVVMDFYKGFMIGYEVFIKPAIDGIVLSLKGLWDAFKPVFDAIGELFGETGRTSEGFGATFAFVIGGIITQIGWIIKPFAFVIGWIAESFVAPFLLGISQLIGGFLDVVTGATSMKAGIYKALKGVTNVLLNTVLRPFKMVFLGVLQAMNFAGMMSNERYKKIADVLNAAPGTPLGRDTATETQDAAARIRDSKGAAEAAAAARAAKTEGNKTNINVKPNVKVDGCVTSNLKVDGKNLAVASAHTRFELSQRGGFGLNPWQQGAIAGGGMPGKG